MGRRSHFFRYPGLSTTVLRKLSSVGLSGCFCWLYDFGLSHPKVLLSAVHTADKSAKVACN